MQKSCKSSIPPRHFRQRKNRLYGSKKKQPAVEAQSYFIRKNLLNIKVGRFEFVIRVI